jgi:Protein of unknown function (DUF3891)
MLFREQPAGALAISQLMHAWLSGQLLRAWDEPFAEPLLLAAEQHDIGWLDWETAPSFNPQTGRPHLFREVGASIHAPMWTLGVNRALHAWGAHVALLVSRHGGVIYSRYTDRHNITREDRAAADAYVATQGAVEAQWARQLGLDEATLKRESALVALVDALSLALCGELKTPLEFQAPDRSGDMIAFRLVEREGVPFEFVLSPWPFREDAVTLEGEGRPLPPEGRFVDEAAMRAWFASPERTMFHARLASR